MLDLFRLLCRDAGGRRLIAVSRETKKFKEKGHRGASDGKPPLRGVGTTWGEGRESVLPSTEVRNAR